MAATATKRRARRTRRSSPGFTPAGAIRASSPLMTGRAVFRPSAEPNFGSPQIFAHRTLAPPLSIEKENRLWPCQFERAAAGSHPIVYDAAGRQSAEASALQVRRQRAFAIDQGFACSWFWTRRLARPPALGRGTGPFDAEGGSPLRSWREALFVPALRGEWRAVFASACLAHACHCVGSWRVELGVLGGDLHERSHKSEPAGLSSGRSHRVWRCSNFA
jgi:hypothetical protein